MIGRMHCPRCTTLPATSTSIYRQASSQLETRATLVREAHASGVTLDRCGSCGGSFLDKGELEKIESAARRKKMRWSTEEIPSVVKRAYAQARRPDSQEAEERKPLDCPQCDGTMFEREWSIGTMVRVDVCIDCRGVWLDGGELETLLALFGGS